MSLKQLNQRFRDWQRTPVSYEEIGSEMHCCSNCGQGYAGAYCPPAGNGDTLVVPAVADDCGCHCRKDKPGVLSGVFGAIFEV